MSGETEENISGWTVDTLHELTISLNRAQDERLRALQGDLDRRMATADGAARQAMADLRAMLDERHAAQTTMADERYATQTKALDAAFKAAEQAVATALASQEKAVSKAEAAADKRFESVNEFRQQLADQTASFPTRVEVSARLDAQAKDIARNTETLREVELRLTSRLDTAAGTLGGAAGLRADKRLDAGQMMQAIVTLAALITLAAVFLHK